MENKEFSRKLKKLRERKGLSQEELANLSGLSLRTIQRMEKGETKPHGDTKRKVVEILESHPDIDIDNELKTDKEKDIFQKMIIKFEYPFILYILSLFLFFIGVSGIKGMIYFGLIIGFLSIIFLVISTKYQLKNKGFKKGGKYLVTAFFSAFIYLFLIILFIPGKRVSVRITNGIPTRIETNFITGRSDTTITVKKLYKHAD